MNDRAGTSASDPQSSVRAPFAAWPGGPFLISTLPPSQQQQSFARALVLLLLLGFFVTVAFRHVQLPRYEAFVPISNTIVFLNDVITVALLYVQFSLTRHRALLVLASGFLFRGLVMIPHTLAFPGVFAPDGLFDASMQTPSFLTIAQYLGFLLSAVAYTLLRERKDEQPTFHRTSIAPIVATTCAVCTAVIFLTWLLVAGGSALPPIMADAVNTTTGFQRFGSRLLLLAVLLSIIVFRRRATSVIDLWLKVAMWSWLLEALLMLVIPSRYSLVFYVDRTLAVVSSCFVLAAFLFESLMLHRRLIATLVAREQERKGHRTSIDIVVGTLAHELRQPLTSILLNEQAVRLLVQHPGRSEEVAEISDEIRESVTRANEIIDSVRAMFAASAGDRGSVDANVLVRDAVELTRLELEAQSIRVHLDLSSKVPTIVGHRGQLLEVLLNGLRNAIESLSEVADRERQLRIRTVPVDPQSVAISIEDSGIGLDARTGARVFDPFFSTKRHGMGLGLSICQSIVLAHGGALSLAPGSPHGAVLRIELPGSVATHHAVPAIDSRESEQPLDDVVLSAKASRPSLGLRSL